MEVAVDDIAEEAGDEGDRARLRALHATAHAKRWESLLDATPPPPQLSVPHTSAFVDGSTSVAVGRAALPGSGVEKRSVARYVYLLLDMTECARQPDYKPRRLEFMVEAACKFARRFFTENPLSELGCVVLRGGSCETVTSACGSYEELSAGLTTAARHGPQGRMSIVNGLLRVSSLLEGVPPYGAKEAILLFASLSTNDPGDTPIEGLITPLRKKRIRVSVVSMSPELHVLRNLASSTDGSYAVALNARHFEELIGEHAPAPLVAMGSQATLIRMGFPRQVGEFLAPAMCVCHSRRCPYVFVCPQCEARVCAVPNRCPICNLRLASAPIIARTFRQLLPTPEFLPNVEIKTLGAAAAGQSLKRKVSGNVVDNRCNGCQARRSLTHTCSNCEQRFCETCAEFLSTVLRMCPGCTECSALIENGSTQQMSIYARANQFK